VSDFAELYAKAADIARDGIDDAEISLLALCEQLKHSVTKYDWVGFYLARPERKDLVLGPFAGEPTEHVRIDYGKGICGQAAERLETFVVQDVAKEKNYLACSPKVRSEIVVPIFREGKLVGEIDIDSHSPEAFTDADRDFLQRIAALFAPAVAALPRK
jgi:L-methionine (R)-S-oxide reductase